MAQVKIIVQVEGANPPTPGITPPTLPDGEIDQDKMRHMEEMQEQAMEDRDRILSTRFQVLCSPPDLSPQPDTGYANIWAPPSMADPETGQFNFNITESYSAICGRLDPLGPGGAALQKGQTCFAEDQQQINLAGGSLPGVVNAVLSNGRFGFDKSASVAAGSFRINDGSWTNDQLPGAFVGIGMPVQNLGTERVAPVYSFAAKSLQDYVITPHRAYYLAIATGNEESGQCVDINDYNQKKLIDFDGKSENTATVTLAKDNSFSDPVFSNT